MVDHAQLRSRRRAYKQLTAFAAAIIDLPYPPRAPTLPTSLYHTLLLLLATTPEGRRAHEFALHPACRRSHRPAGCAATQMDCNTHCAPRPCLRLHFILTATSGRRPLVAEHPDRAYACTNSRALRVPCVNLQQSRTGAHERQLQLHAPDEARRRCPHGLFFPQQGVVLLAPVGFSTAPPSAPWRSQRAP